MYVYRRRTPQGVRGLKPTIPIGIAIEGGRTPQGVRGLKLASCPLYFLPKLSHSARSAWIETGCKNLK